MLHYKHTKPTHYSPICTTFNLLSTICTQHVTKYSITPIFAPKIWFAQNVLFKFTPQNHPQFMKTPLLWWFLCHFSAYRPGISHGFGCRFVSDIQEVLVVPGYGMAMARAQWLGGMANGEAWWIDTLWEEFWDPLEGPGNVSLRSHLVELYWIVWYSVFVCFWLNVKL